MTLSKLPLVIALLITAPLLAQNQNPEDNTSNSTVRITTHAVLLDVVVTDRNGNPVTGLTQDAFSVAEKGKPQTISFFEEHKTLQSAAPIQLPTLPLNVFTNFTPIAPPAAVNVLLLDSLNTPIEDQAYVHKQAMKYLKSLKPGTRMAIFTMSMGLRFVQGFTDDPALLMAALGSKKSGDINVPVQIKTPEEDMVQETMIGQMAEVMPAGPGGTVTSATQAMIDAMNDTFTRTDVAQQDDRAYRTLANLQQLAAFLGGFPGRKNLIWFSESIPLTFQGMATAQFNGTDTRTETRFDGDLRKTIALLTTARVAVYPVDARGSKPSVMYDASTAINPLTSSASQIIGVNGLQATGMLIEDSERNGDQETMKMLAHDSGGKAYLNTNGLAGVIADVVASSSDFYTVSYTPDDRVMDGRFRPIEVHVAGGNYTLSYRRGYFADNLDLPGSVGTVETADAANPANSGPDPLGPFMEFGMPQTEQILYKTLVKPLPPGQDAAEAVATKGPHNNYMVNFAVDLKDLNLKEDAQGMHKGTLDVCMIVYDRYGNIALHRDHVVALNIKPDAYKVFQQTGVQFRDVVEVPKGQYWLRTGLLDPATRKTGTLEFPLSAVKTADTAAIN